MCTQKEKRTCACHQIFFPEIPCTSPVDRLSTIKPIVFPQSVKSKRELGGCVWIAFKILTDPRIFDIAQICYFNLGDLVTT